LDPGRWYTYHIRNALRSQQIEQRFRVGLANQDQAFNALLDKFSRLPHTHFLGRVHAAQHERIMGCAQIMLQSLDQYREILMAQSWDHNADRARSQRSKGFGNAIRHPLEIKCSLSDSLAKLR